jgi:hypothetical protein
VLLLDEQRHLGGDFGAAAPVYVSFVISVSASDRHDFVVCVCVRTFCACVFGLTDMTREAGIVYYTSKQSMPYKMTLHDMTATR